MCTFNGADYIEEQIASIQEQTYKNWRLLIRDDGSSDGTMNILHRLAGADSRIQISKDKGNKRGAAHGYLWLLQHISGDFFAFSDQDDYWLPDKLEVLLDVIGTVDPHQKMAIVFSDSLVAENDLSIRYPSFMRFQRFNPSNAGDWRHELMQNVVSGNVLIGTAHLAKICCSVSDLSKKTILMHDWWVTLLAAFLGDLYYVSKPLVLYRQHSGNVLGAKGSGLIRYLDMLIKELPWRRACEYMRKVGAQAHSFLESYGRILNPEHRLALRTVSKLSRKPRAIDVASCLARGIKTNTCDRDIMLILSSIFCYDGESS